MKKIVIFLIFSFHYVYGDLSMNQIEHMVKKIHEKREGVKLDALEQTKEPFVRLLKEHNITTFVIPKKEKEKKLTLYAIVNTKAYINDRWLKKGNKILGFDVEYVGKSGVVLRSGNQIKKLFLHKRKSDLITIEERD